MAFVEKIGDLNPYASLLARDLPLNFVDTLQWDYDGDGDRDRITVAANGSIQYFRNDGSGTYTQITGNANPFSTINVGVGGRLALDSGDLVVAVADGSVRYFEKIDQSTTSIRQSTNDERPSIHTPFTTLHGTAFTTSGGWTNENIYSRKLADVNGDGRADIVGFGGGSVVVSLGQTNGSFASPLTVLNTTFTNAQGWNTQYSRQLADVNGDGRADIIGFGHDAVIVALGQSNGGFGNSIRAFSGNFLHAQGWTDENIYSRYVADVNGDGRADIVGFGARDVAVALGQSDGTFGTSFQSLSGGAFSASQGWNNESRYARRLADVNGDGRADIVGFYENRIDVSLGQSNGTFAAPVRGLSGIAFTASQGWNNENVYSRHLEDINGDGRADIVGFGSGSIVAALGKADGTFENPFVLDNSGAFTNISGWANESRYARRVADVDGDGVADILGFYDDRVHVGLNDYVPPQVKPLRDAIYANGNFTHATAFTAAGSWTNENIYSRKLADVNGDGRGDIVGFGNGSVVVALGQSDGTFRNLLTVLNTTFTNVQGWNNAHTSRHLADVNGDGRDDIVGFGHDVVVVALGQSNGGFGNSIRAFSGNYLPAQGWDDENLYSRYVADVNGDGRADIVGFGNRDVYVALGQSNGTFSGGFTALAGGAFTASYGWNNESRYARRLADVNGDGRADIVGFYEDRIDVSLGQSNGTFSAPMTGLSGGAFTASQGWSDENLYSRHLEDINGDGRADIVGFGRGAIVAALGKADGTFDNPFSLDNSGAFTNAEGWTDESRYARRVADVDGDGVADIVGFSNDAVRVALNQLSTKVNPLEDFVQSSASSISADTTLALAIASSITAPTSSLQTAAGITTQALSRQIFASASSLTGVLATYAVRASTRAVFNSASWGLLIGAELASVILAKTGNTELAGYFGSGANPLVDVSEVGNRVGVDAGEVAARAFSKNFLGDVSDTENQIADVVIQTAVNIITSPVQTFINLFNGSPSTLRGAVTGRSVPHFLTSSISVNHYQPSGRVTGEGGHYMSILGSLHDDVLKGYLWVSGDAGNDTLVGRLDTTNDAYFRSVSQRIAAGEREMAGHYLNDRFYYETKKRVGRTSHKIFSRLDAAYYPDPDNSKLDGGTGNDKLFSKVTAHLDGGSGNDTLNTTYYSRTLQGGTGDDIITLDINAVDTAFNLQSIQGGAGNDHLFLRGLYNQTLTLTNTSLQFQGTSNVSLSGIEQVTVAGSSSNETINASGFSGEALLKGGAGNDVLTGSVRASSLLGEAGNDTLVGGAQGDVLVGGTGADILTGNGGADVFLLNTADAAHDTITDFNQAQGDLIVIDTTAFGKLYEGDLANFRIGSSNGNSEIYYGTNKLATINGSNGSDLQVGRTVIFTEYHVATQV